MKNNKHILLGLLALSGVSAILGTTSIETSAWGNSNSSSSSTSGRITWTSFSSTGRPIAGYFKANQLMPKNPSFPGAVGAYVSNYKNDSQNAGNSLYYRKEAGQKVETAMFSYYGYDILFYAPNKNSNGSSYKSVWADGVDENFYTVMSSTFSNKSYWSYYPLHTSDTTQSTNTKSGLATAKGWTGSLTNFTNRTSQPNVSGRAQAALASSTGILYDNRFDTFGNWRYIGYNIAGEALNSPFFISDSVITSPHHSDQGVVSKGLHGLTFGQSINNLTSVNNKYYQYDEPTFLAVKKAAIARLLELNPEYKTGQMKYVTGTISSTSTYPNSQTKNLTSSSTSTLTVDHWTSALNLMTNPLLETPMFEGYRIENLSSSTDRLRYIEVTAPTDPQLTNDLRLNKLTVKDSSGSVIATFTRSGTSYTSNIIKQVVPGNKITVEYEIENVGTSTTTINPSTFDSGIAINSGALANDYNNRYNNNIQNKKLTASGTIAPGAKKTFTTSYTVPDNTQSSFRVTGNISEDYKDFDGTYDNNWGHVVTGVAHGDTGITNIQLIDRDGNVIDDTRYMKPGEDYKVRYTVKYTGPDRESATNLQLSTTIKRWLPGGSSEVTSNYSFAKNNVYLKNGDTFTFETGYITFEVPRVETTANLYVPNSSMNSNTSNDSASKAWAYNYDVILSNVRVYNTNERPTQDGYITLGVKYDIDVIAPTQTPYFEVDLKTNITLPNGQVIQFTDHVAKGSNPDITHEIQVPVTVITSGSKTLPVQIYTNADKKFWETDLSTQSNNKGSSSATQLAPLNPNTTRGCSIVKDSNSLTVSHKLTNYFGNKINYYNFAGNRQYEFYRYNNAVVSSVSKTYNETYQINYVKFKSKDTVDNNYGTNGWVDLTKSSEKNLATIKAGYGYELEIEVAYKTNALTSQPTSSQSLGSSTSSGTSVTNQNVSANIYKDIYVRTSDGQILSATGMYGTTPAFNVEVVTSNSETTVLKYTMKTTSSNGISSPVKVYTSEDAVDGSYGLTVWTPTITGFGNPTKAQVDLCDQENVSYSINGSMYDDNQDSIIQ